MDTLEEAIKSPRIASKVVAKRSHAMWDIVLSTKEEAKQLARNVLMTKTGVLGYAKNKDYPASSTLRCYGRSSGSVLHKLRKGGQCLNNS